VIAPLGIALAGPTYGEAIVYAELEAWMIKATKAIVDTMGHYARHRRARRGLRQGDRNGRGRAPRRRIAGSPDAAVSRA
jgi:hypothetical protein